MSVPIIGLNRPFFSVCEAFFDFASHLKQHHLACISTQIRFLIPGQDYVDRFSHYPKSHRTLSTFFSCNSKKSHQKGPCTLRFSSLHALLMLISWCNRMFRLTEKLILICHGYFSVTLMMSLKLRKLLIRGSFSVNYNDRLCLKLRLFRSYGRRVHTEQFHYRFTEKGVQVAIKYR